MGTRRRYTEEFKKEAVMVMQERGNRPVREVAESLGVALSQLHAWRKKYGAAAHGKRAVSVEGLERENAQLHRENAQLRREREVLKKSIAFFVKENS